MLRLVLGHENVSLEGEYVPPLSGKGRYLAFVKIEGLGFRGTDARPIFHKNVYLDKSNEIWEVKQSDAALLATYHDYLQHNYLFASSSSTERSIIPYIPRRRSPIECDGDTSNDAYGLALDYFPNLINFNHIAQIGAFSLSLTGTMYRKISSPSGSHKTQKLHMLISHVTCLIIGSLILILLRQFKMYKLHLENLADVKAWASLLSVIYFLARYLFLLLNLAMMINSGLGVFYYLENGHIMMLVVFHLFLFYTLPKLYLLSQRERRIWQGRSVLLLPPSKLERLLLLFGSRGDGLNPGTVRLSWKCKCGRRFFLDLKQSQTDISFFAIMFNEILRKPTPSGRAAGRHSGLEDCAVGNPAPATYSPKNSSSHLFLGRIERVSTRESISHTRKNAETINDIRLRKSADQKIPYKRWILTCFPQKRGDYKLEHTCVLERRGDNDLFQEIQRLYEKQRPKNLWPLNMRDVTKIHLVKFHVRKIQNLKISQEVVTRCEKWELPDAASEPDWEYLNQEDIGLDTLPEFLMYLWHLAKEAKSSKSLGQSEPRSTIDINCSYGSEPILPTTEASLSNPKPFWARSIRAIKVFLPPKSKKASTLSHASENPSRFWLISQWCSSFVSSSKQPPPAPTELELHALPSPLDCGFEIEISPPPASWVFESIPKRIRSKLVPDPSCRRAVAGWGLWIQEDFVISWTALALINLVLAVSLAISVGLSVKRGMVWFTIAGYGISLASFILAQWVAKTKDSKR